MKLICICQPIIPDIDLPIAIHPTSETRKWRQKQNFKMFFSQYKLDKRDYQIVLYKKSKDAQPFRYSVKKRWKQVVRKLAINKGYIVKGPREVWLNIQFTLEPPKEPESMPFEVYPLDTQALVQIINSLVIDSGKQYRYSVIARHLHDLGFPIPNLDTRKLYMKILFKELRNVINRIADETLSTAERRKEAVGDVFWSYLGIDCTFWQSNFGVNSICGKMKDLCESKPLYVQAVPATRPVDCNIP